MFRDDEAARASYVASLERTAARVEALERRLREIEAENRRLAADNTELRKRLAVAAPAGEPYVDGKLHDYAAALVRATDPERTEGIVHGAPAGDAVRLIERAAQLARDARRAHVLPDEVALAARELLPTRITCDPEVDPTNMVRAILGAVAMP